MTDDEAAIAAAKRYFSEFTNALATRDTVALRRTFLGCRVCIEDADRIDQAKLSGWTFEKAIFDLQDVRVTSRADATHILVRGSLSSPPLVVRDAQGKVVHSSAGAVGAKDMIIVKSSTAWLVQAIS